MSKLLITPPFTMSSLKTIKLYNHGGGPNPPKVAIIVEELGIPYESTYPGPSAIKQEPYISLDPNGRLPAIEDPNTGLVLWEVKQPCPCLYNPD